MRIEVIDTAQGFNALRPLWNDLQERTERTSVFTSWDWQYHWWQVYGGSHRLRVVVVFEGETAIGILPLYLRREPIIGPLGAQVLRFVGTGGDTDPDDLGPLLDTRFEQEAAAALTQFVISNRPMWDVLLLTDLSLGVPFTNSITEAAAIDGFRLDRAVSAHIRFLELPTSFEALLASFSRNRRWRFRRDRRRIEEQFRTRFFVWHDPVELDRAVDRLGELHCARWQAAGQRHSFASPEYVDFHRSVMRACLERDWLRLYCLEVDGQLAAILYCYHFRNQVFLMQSGFDPTLADWSPGSVLLGYAIEHMIAEGNHILDFLRGEHRYKDELATCTRETISLTGWRLTPGGLAARLRRFWAPQLRNWLRMTMGRS